jgi:PleD family two-component response regulator
VGVVVAFPRMPGVPEQRRGPDRRSRPRGGRRTEDRQGFAPLVLLVDADPEIGAHCEAILAKLRFAVAPTSSADEAARVMEALRPNIIVVRGIDPDVLRRVTPADVPLVPISDEHGDAESFVDAIRRGLRRAAK